MQAFCQERGAGKHGNVQTLVATMAACYSGSWSEPGTRGASKRSRWALYSLHVQPCLTPWYTESAFCSLWGGQCVHVPVINRSIHT